jgi:PAS domain S-box-containing protein
MDEGFAVMEVLLDEQGEAFDCRYVQTNPSFEAQAGLDKVVGHTMKELMPGLEARWIKAYGDVVRTGDSIRFLDHTQPLDRWFEVFLFPYGRSPTRRVGVLFRDQTEQVRAKEKLRLSEAHLSAVVEFADAAIISVDEQLRVVLFNPAAQRMFGVDAQAMMGQPLDRLMPQRFRDGHPQHMRDFERSGTSSRRMMNAVELVGLRANGEEFPIEASISRAEVEGKPLLTAIIRDVSEAKALASERLARAAAEEASASKTRFLSHLSHELRTPLNAIIGFSQICIHRAEQEGLPSLADLLRHVLDAGHHQLSMIEDLLDLSRIESNQLLLHIEEVGFAEVILECVEMVQGQANAAQIQIDWASTQISTARAPADRRRLKQVLINLLTNAIKYNKPAGMVYVSVKETKAEVAVEVRDTGVGMSSEQLEALFVPFARLGYETSRIEGTGIGLTISKRLMELMHGRLQVESMPGQGSTFTAALPSESLHLNPPAKPSPFA